MIVHFVQWSAISETPLLCLKALRIRPFVLLLRRVIRTSVRRMKPQCGIKHHFLPHRQHTSLLPQSRVRECSNETRKYTVWTKCRVLTVKMRRYTQQSQGREGLCAHSSDFITPTARERGNSDKTSSFPPCNWCNWMTHPLMSIFCHNAQCNYYQVSTN